jgi:hypothetical protein
MQRQFVQISRRRASPEATALRRTGWHAAC